MADEDYKSTVSSISCKQVLGSPVLPTRCQVQRFLVHQARGKGVHWTSWAEEPFHRVALDQISLKLAIVGEGYQWRPDENL